MTKNYDHYSVADTIIQKLRDCAQTEWADKLEEAIASGSTGTEIFMSMRWQLQQFRNSGEACDPGTEQLIDELLNRLNKALE